MKATQQSGRGVGRRRGGRRRAPRAHHARSLAGLSVLAAAVVVLGLAGAGGTYALLRASVATPQATISAGTLNLQVNGATTAPLGTWTVTPATPVARSFTVTSTGDVPSTLAAHVTATTSQAITVNTQARITPVTSAAACTVGLAGPLANLDGYSRPALDQLPPGQTKTFCLEVRLLPGTPVSQSGQGVTFNLNLTATQSAA